MRGLCAALLLASGCAKDTLEHMRKAKEKGTLHVRYDGIDRLDGIGDCYKIVRTPYDSAEGLEKENLNELTIWIDQRTLMQVRSVLKNTDAQERINWYEAPRFERSPATSTFVSRTTSWIMSISCGVYFDALSRGRD